MTDDIVFYQPNTFMARFGFCLSSLLFSTGVGKYIPVKFKPSSVGQLPGLIGFLPLGAGNRVARSDHLRHWLPLFVC